jgi:hypothetical protein
MFFAPARYMVVKIVHSYSEVVLWFNIEDEQWLQWGEPGAWDVREVKGEMILYPLPEG